MKFYITRWSTRWFIFLSFCYVAPGISHRQLHVVSILVCSCRRATRRVLYIVLPQASCFFLVLEYSVVDKAKSASKCLRVTVYLFCCRYKPVNLFGAHRATPFPYPQPGTSWHCVTTIRASASRDMPVYSPALAGYSLRLPPEGRWLRRRGVWFHTEMV